MKLFNKIIVCLIAVVVSVTPLFAADNNPYTRGLSSFEYTEYEPLKDRPITVYCYIPTKGDIQNMRVLFMLHGAGRKPLISMKAWNQFAERDGFIVIAPQYDMKLYPGWRYQTGGVVYKGKVQPRENWTYNSIEAIFDHFKKHTGSKAEVYDMFGHSAGGQFTHRFALAMPEARLNIGVAANPGHWTMPLVDGLPSITTDKKYGWPYSVKGTPLADAEVLKKFLSRKLYIQVGKDDVKTSGKWVPTGDKALSQGEHRLGRARNMYKTSKKVAKKNKWEFNWTKVEVKGVGHNSKGMIYGTYTLDENGKKKFSMDNITKNGAYYILYQLNK